MSGANIIILIYMKLSVGQLKHISRLANLSLTMDEGEKYSKELSKILDFIEKLNQADTKIESTFNVSGQNNVTREDLINPCLSQKEALQNAAKKERGFFTTRGIFNNE